MTGLTVQGPAGQAFSVGYGHTSGRLQSVSGPAGTFSYGYLAPVVGGETHGSRRWTTLTRPGGGVIEQQYVDRHDAGGNRTVRSSGSGTLTYAWDAADQMKQALTDTYYTPEGSRWREDLVHDALGRLRERKQYTWLSGTGCGGGAAVRAVRFELELARMYQRQRHHHSSAWPRGQPPLFTLG